MSRERSLSFFEFWPAWLMYIPVGLQWLALSLRYRSLTVPFLANPSLTLSGMVGVPKSELMKQAKGVCAQTILPWIVVQVDAKETPRHQALTCISKAEKQGIYLPFVCKPDIGCRGVGVKYVETLEQLAEIITSYPPDAPLLCQKLASWEPEVGIFYVKNPATGESRIVSMASKSLPKVIGDGQRTLKELIANSPRAGRLKHLYYERHKETWDSIPKKDEVVRLVFSASHSKGAIFRDACQAITPALTQAISTIMHDLPDFYYGRLDVKFSDLDSLKQGQNLEIVEINAASSEALHIWDKDARLLEAIQTLLWQYRMLFKIGAYHRHQGKKPPKLRTFIQHWLKERRLSKYYPLTD